MSSARQFAGGLRPTVLALGLALVAPGPAAAFLDSLNPFADTKDEFEGRFIATLEPGPWTPTLERLMAEEKASSDKQAAESKPPEPPRALPDGLTLLRIGEPSVPRVPEWETYLNGIGAHLLAGSPVTGAPVRYYVTASEDYGTAKAYPDGAIGIPLGLLRQVGSEDELAFVLAHEAAHVILGHHDNDWYQSMHQNLVSAAEEALGIGVHLSNTLGQSGFAQEAAKIGLIAGGTLLVTDKGLFPSFTREQEDEADLLGLDLAIRAGYNSQGAFDAFAKFLAWEEALAARPDPRAQERAELEKDVEQSANRGAVDTAVQGVLGMLSLAGEEAADEVAVTHRSAAAREESLLDYFFREYAEEVPPDSRVAELERVRNGPGGRALLDTYAAAWDALGHLSDGKLAEAETLSREAVGGSFKTDSLSRFAFYRTRLEQGRLDKAAKNLEFALEGPNPSLVIYRQLAALHWRQGQRGKAMTILRNAFKEFQEPPELYAELIYRTYLLGDRHKAAAMARDCKFRNREAGEVCSKAARGQGPGGAQGGAH